MRTLSSAFVIGFGDNKVFKHYSDRYLQYFCQIFAFQAFRPSTWLSPRTLHHFSHDEVVFMLGIDDDNHWYICMFETQIDFHHTDWSASKPLQNNTIYWSDSYPLSASYSNSYTKIPLDHLLHLLHLLHFRPGWSFTSITFSIFRNYTCFDATLASLILKQIPAQSLTFPAGTLLTITSDGLSIALYSPKYNIIIWRTQMAVYA